MSASQLNDWILQKKKIQVTILNLVYEYRCRLRDIVVFNQLLSFLSITQPVICHSKCQLFSDACDIHSLYVCHFLEFFFPLQNKKGGKVLSAACAAIRCFLVLKLLTVRSCKSKKQFPLFPSALQVLIIKETAE